MPVFKDAKQQTRHDILVNMLHTLSTHPATTQRDLAQKLGISLGMTVTYIKSSMIKGYIRTSKVSARRWAYFVTPKGFAEKSKMVGSYLTRSANFFKQTRMQIEAYCRLCEQQNDHIVILGRGEVVEIARLIINTYQISWSLLNDAYNFSHQDHQCVLICDTHDPQGSYNVISQRTSEDLIFTIDTLCVVRNKNYPQAQKDKNV